MRQELKRRDELPPPNRRLRALAVSGIAVVFGLLAWHLRRSSSIEESRSNRPTDASLGGSVVSSEKAAYAAPSGSQLLDATAISVKEEARPLILVATSPGRMPNEGTARIGVDPKAPQTYSAGAILLNGARLIEIHHRYVVLERDGERVRLSLNRTADVPELAWVGPGAEEPRPVLATDRLSEILRLSPVYENDLLVGMRIFPGARPEVFSQLGLRAGDVITAIDGAPIFAPDGMSELFEPLLQGGLISVTAKRLEGDQSVTLDGSIVVRIFDGSVSAALPAAAPPTS